ncbi:MAG: 1-acyl-sn-glycerol-3-phosphate acyltransferase [Candidatus Lernaella stagnicola]|nr:1-acyl-sn-glycerol-3-phosphate acyltransferase [Candidatus Lernaella stagnicola]
MSDQHPPASTEIAVGSRAAWHNESFWQRWGRRAITIPGYLVGTVVIWLIAPVVIPIVAIVDLIRRDKWSALRAYAFLLMYFGAEFAGILALFAAWLFSGVWAGVNRRQFLDWNYTIQRWWAKWLWQVGRRIYRLNLIVDNFEVATPGPILVFFRHAAMPDTILPAELFLVQQRMRLRYVMKRDLLWDACLDIGGNRLPNYFVRRDSQNTTRETDILHAMTADVAPDEGVMIYPEGTRFSHRKRDGILRRLRERGNEAALKRAESLKHVLPPRLGGALAILEGNPGMDAVFCTHVGFEIANRLYNLINGALVGRTIHINMWRVPFKDIPTETAARIEWLFEQWRRVDRWISEHIEKI